MKKTSIPSLLLLTLLLFSSTLDAQRYIPLIEEGRTLTESIQGPNGIVHDFALYHDKLLFVGEFDQVNGRDIQNLAYWDGTNFSSFEVPLEGDYEIRDVLVTPLGLVISGRFDGGNILLFNENQWVSLGQGLIGAVSDIVWFEGKLHVCGEFTNSGIIDLRRIASWNGTEWEQLGAGLNNAAKEMAIFEDELYVVGDFVNSGEVELHHIGKWDGQDWSAVVQGFDDNANCLEIYDGNLVVGGRFAGNSSQTELYSQLVTLEEDDFVSIADGNLEVNEIGYLSTLEEQLFFSEGRNEFDEFTEGKGFVTNNGEVSDLFSSHSVGELFDYEGNVIANSLVISEESFEQDFYQLSPLGRLMKDGLYAEEFKTTRFQTDVSCSATNFHSMNDRGGAGFKIVDGIVNDDSPGTIFSMCPWIGGSTPDGQLHMNRQTFQYFDLGGEYFNFGPKSDLYDNDYVERYFRVWKITAEEILIHQTHYLESDYEMDETIKNWPGNGRDEHNESFHLAPFVDVDENGLYEPQLGDYPFIKGDLAVWYVLNTSRTNNPIAKSDLEIAVMFYAFIDQGEDLNNTVQVSYKLLNKSNQSYGQMRFGVWSDLDIGNNSDDYIGCHPEQNLFYGYNGDAIDEPSSKSSGYISNVPAQAFMFLNQPMNKFLYYNASTSANGNPDTALEAWNYMNGIWKNGIPMTYGGDGYASGNDPNTLANFMFPYNPPEGQFPWNEITAGNEPGDRRGLASTDFFTLDSGESVCIDIAAVTVFPEMNNTESYTILPTLFDRAQTIQDIYDNQLSGCAPETFSVTLRDLDQQLGKIEIYPNPTVNAIQIEGIQDKMVSVEIFDLSGRAVVTQTLKAGERSLSVSHLVKGLYTVRILENDKVLFWQKIIKR